jgi:hypothetical protein
MSQRFAHAQPASWNRIEKPRECVALGDSREPPVATFFGRMERSKEYREVV